MVLGNTPWFTESEFEDRIRVLVGSAGTDDVTTAVYTACSNSAHARLLSMLPDGARRYRTLCDRVPGERVPQEGVVLADGEYEHTLLIPNAVLTPATKAPRVWKNLVGRWEDRFAYRETKLLTSGTDYTIDATTLTISAAEEGDVFWVEYWHTLDTPPEILNFLAIMMTAEAIINARFGTDSAAYDNWAKIYKDQYQSELRLLKEERLPIPEFDLPVLYVDWDDSDSDVETVTLLRG